MVKVSLKYLVVLLILISCTTATKNIDKKKYKKSRTLVTYSGGANELQDGYLVLKENNYFEFYQKTWLIINIKEAGVVGRYSQANDTLYLNWLDINPKKIKHYLSSKCVIDSTTKTLWFIDEATNERLWGLGRRVF